MGKATRTVTTEHIWNGVAIYFNCEEFECDGGDCDCEDEEPPMPSFCDGGDCVVVNICCEYSKY